MELLFLIPLFALAEYIAGRPFPLPGRSVWYVTPVLMGILTLFKGYSVPLWPLGLGWACWRSVLGWSTFGGSEDPKTIGELERTALRDVVALLFLTAWLYFIPSAAVVPLVGAAVAFSVAAWSLAALQGKLGAHGADKTIPIDLARGASFGLIYSLVFMYFV